MVNFWDQVQLELSKYWRFQRGILLSKVSAKQPIAYA